MKYYAVHKGRKTGIYFSWDICKKQIDGFENPIFKKFDNEKDAKIFVENGFQNKNNYVSRKTNIDKKNEQLLENELKEDSTNKVFIYTDGSCIKFSNGLFKAGYGIYIPKKNIRVGEPLLNQKQTNNRAELTAILKAFLYLTEEEKKSKKIVIITDSQYSIYIFKDTGINYEKDGFMKDGKEVLNKDLIIEALKIKRAYNVVLLKIRAHTSKDNIHVRNNEIVDKLAKDGAYKNTHNNTSSNIFQKRIETCQDEDYFDNLDYGSLPTNINTGIERMDISNNNNLYTEKSVNVNKSFFETENIKKDITMNELFGYDELLNDNDDDNNKIKKNKKKTTTSNNLNKWFIKS